jgi:hypothetical protein
MKLTRRLHVCFLMAFDEGVVVMNLVPNIMRQSFAIEIVALIGNQVYHYQYYLRKEEEWIRKGMM